MSANQKTVLVTGVSGNLGRRLLPLLDGYRVIGVDFREPFGANLAHFASMDLGREESCRALIDLIRQERPATVVHLAFVIDPAATGVLEQDRMWQINVAGTARVMEAIATVNRLAFTVERFVYPSSVAVYGPETPGPVDENAAHNAHTLTYALHKRECDAVARDRATTMGDCNTTILRPHIFTGASMKNYLVDALRGTAYGTGSWGQKLRRKGWKLPLLLPFGEEYPEKLFQFVHVDDVARVMAHFVGRPHMQGQPAQIFNLAGRGEAVTIAQAAALAHARIRRLPSRALCQKVLNYLWNTKTATIPPDAYPYMIGSYTMNTDRLRKFLGPDYERLIHYTVRDALADSFQPEEQDLTA